MNTIEICNKNEVNEEEIEISCFFCLIAMNNLNEMTDYINKLNGYYNEYFSLISSQYNNLNEFYQNFINSEERNQTKKNINSPFYIVEYALKELVFIQMKNLKSIIDKGETLISINNKLIKFQEVIGKLSDKFTNSTAKNSYNGIDINQIKNISNSLDEAMHQIENKIIEQYIYEKYNEQLLENNNDGNNNENKNIEEQIKVVKYYEKSLIDYINGNNEHYFNELKHSDNKIQNEFNKIKIILLEYVSFIKDNNIKMVKELENLENQIKSKKISDMIKKEADISFTKSDLRLNLKEIFENIYKISILKNKRIELKILDEKNEENKKDINEIKSSKNKKNYRLLNDKDIYEIISKLYSYDLLVINRKQYNIELEKGKLDARDLSSEIFKYNDQSEDIQKELNEKYDELIKLIEEKILNNIANIEAFFLELNNYRSYGRIKFSEKFFSLIIFIYKKTQDILLNKTDKNIIDLMLILSQTYYKEINNKKIFIEDEIKTHALYKSADFWKEAIIKKIDDDIKTYKKLSSKRKISYEKGGDNVTSKLLTFIKLMSEYDISKDNILEILNSVMDKYNIDSKKKKKIFSFIYGK